MRLVFGILITISLLSCAPSKTQDATFSSVSRVIAESDEHQLKFDDQGNSNVYLNGEQITFDEYVYTEVVESKLAGVAWVYYNDSNSVTQIVLNGQELGGSPGYNRNLFFYDGTLYWLKTDGNGHYVCRFSSSTSCFELDYIPEYAANISGDLLVTGYSPTANKYFLCSYKTRGEGKHCASSAQAYVYIEKEDKKAIFKVDSSRTSNSDFWALKWLLLSQKGDPYAFSNDYKGRVTNNVSYRIWAVTALYEATEQNWLKLYLQQIIQSVMSGAQDDGLFYSKKYSASKKTKIAFAIDNGLIWSAMLRASEYLEDEQKTNLLNKAQMAIDFYEKDWFESSSEYRFPTSEEIDYDGVSLPINQQSSMGLFALELAEATGKVKYLTRAKVIFSKLQSELVDLKGVKVWRYWPKSFYDGWPEGKYNSLTRPHSPPSVDNRFDDFIHADLTIEFVKRYANLTGEANPIDTDGIIDNLRVGNGKYSFFMGGDVETVTPSWSYFPLNNLADLSGRNGWLKRNSLITAVPEYDNQLVFLTYARNTEAVQGTVTLTSVRSNDNFESIIEINASRYPQFINDISQFFQGGFFSK